MDLGEGFQKGALQGVFVGKVDCSPNAWDHPDVANLNNNNAADEDAENVNNNQVLLMNSS